MVRTLQDLRMAARLGHDCGCVVPTNVVEGTQRALAPTDNDDGLSREPCRHKVSRLLQLIGAGDELPGLAEDVEPLELGDPGIDIPRRRNGRRLRQRGSVVVAGENLFNGCLHIYALDQVY